MGVDPPGVLAVIRSADPGSAGAGDDDPVDPSARVRVGDKWLSLGRASPEKIVSSLSKHGVCWPVPIAAKSARTSANEAIRSFAVLFFPSASISSAPRKGLIELLKSC